MEEQVITKKAKSLLVALAASGIVDEFYLAGGTALALQYGHRRSVDFDWFSQKDFDTGKLKGKLSGLGELAVTGEEEGTLNISVNKIKLSFFRYPYKNLFPLISYDGVRLADARDIACMKLSAIAGRGTKKDFIDLYFLLQDYDLEQIRGWFDKKYRVLDYSHLHILKSLTYFKDADNEPMPTMLTPVSWPKIKKELIARVKL